jgi:hypothetical protein
MVCVVAASITRALLTFNGILFRAGSRGALGVEDGEDIRE